MNNLILFPLLLGAGLLAGYSFGNVRNSSVTKENLSRNPSLSEDRETSIRERARRIVDDHPKTGELLSALVSGAQEQDYLKGRVAMYQLLEQITAAEIPPLLESIQKLPLKLRRTVMAALVERWLKVDATTAGDWISAHSNDQSYLAAWARTNPLAALTSILTSKQSTFYWEAPKVALDHLAGKDPSARISLLLSLPASVNRDEMILGEVAELSKTNPVVALQVANASLTGKRQTAAVHHVILEWVKADPAAATAQFTSLLPELTPGLQGNGFVSNFTLNMAEKNPAAALELAASLPDELRKYPLIAAATAWAKTEPLAALEWSMENGVHLIESFRADGTTMSQTVLRSALEVQPKETINWLINLPASSKRQQYIKSALQDQLWKQPAGTDPLSQANSPALQLFNALLPHEKERMAAQIGGNLAGKGTFPDEVQLKGLFPDEAIRTRVMAGALGAIFSQSASRAETLMTQIPEGPARDHALREITFAQSYATPDLAAQRAMQINSKDLQHSALDFAVSSWLRRDEAACRAWLDSTKELPAEWVADWLADAKAQ